MLVNADLSEVAEEIPAGTYAARMVDVEAKESKAGNSYLNWKGEIFDHAEFNGRTFFHMTMLKGKGAFALRDLYTAATGEELPKGSTSFDTEQILGQELRVVLADDFDDEGNKRSFPKVKSITKL